MTNTNKLKIEVEHELIESFCSQYECEKLNFAPKNKLTRIFFGIEPDLVAYNKNNRKLYVGEITVSGYNGHRGKDFHVGAVRKFAESFSKFYILSLGKNEIHKEIIKLYPYCDFEQISCYFIVPAGSKFMNALGYREKLLKTGIMEKAEISLSDNSKKIMLEVLECAKNEMTT
jgi:hypothetical protein